MKGRFHFLMGALALLVTTSAFAETEKPKFKDDPIRLETKANVKLEVNLRSLLVNPQITTPITWSIRNHPTWLVLDKENEKLSGTPSAGDAGVFDFRGITVNADDIGGDFDHRVVLSVFAPPVWASPDIDLGIQNEDKPFTFDLKTVITDASGGTLTFSATGLPQWMTLNGSILSGTPRRADVGNYAGIVFTATGKGGSAKANGFGKVIKTVKPPKWVAKEITLENALEDSAYNRNVTEFALNNEGTPLEYEIVSITPPPWLQIGKTSGALFGTPRKANIGVVNVAVILKTKIDGVSFDDTTTFKFSVIHVNHAPQWLNDPINLPPGLTKVKYQQELASSSTDPDDGDVLTYKIVSFSGPGANWATIDSKTGLLSGTPDKANLGQNSWLISVTDQGGLTDTASVLMTVNKSNEPPFWNKKPTVLADAFEDKNYEVDLADFATDPDNDALTFTKLDGPAWIKISASGVLTGVPKAADVGAISFRVKVDDLKSGSDVTDVKLNVVHTNHAPTWVLNPIQASTKEEQPIVFTVNQFAKDVDNDKLTFTLLEGPAWAKLNAEGAFSGTPQIADEGVNTFKVRATDPGGLFADATVKITVLHVNHKPFWTQNPIVLPEGFEGVAYSQSVAEFAKDPDNDPLTFTKISGPAWVNIGSGGSITGTPTRADVGINFIEVRIMDPGHELADSTIKIEIKKVNKPPRWRQNPIQMGDALEDTTFLFDLSEYAVDDDGDELTFKLIELQGAGQAWMFVGEDGKTTGVPLKQNIGAFTATFEVSDGQGGVARTKGVGQVIHKNHPPVISPELPEFRIKERQIFTESLNQPKYVADPDAGDRLNFILEDSSDFVTLAPNGDLVAKPLRKHVGQHSFRFKVDDGLIPVHGILRIVVLKDPRPPIWIIDPIADKGKTNELYKGMLADKAKDLDGERLTFSKLSGPGWLTVNGQGDTSGTPLDANLGLNTFKVQACNESGLCTPATLNITVEPGTKEDVYAVDEPVPNARVENLWTVDNSSHCDKTIKELKKHINVFYNELALAKFPVQHRGIFLSSDAHKWDGLPIRDVGQGMLMQAESASSSTVDFVKRVDAAYSNGACGNCYNSPIWSMFRFYQRLPGLTEIYHNGYMMPSIPMDAMIITNQKDHYPYYTKNTPQKNYRPEDYARDFLNIHNAEKKAFRVSAIAPACPSLVEAAEGASASTTADDNAYRTVVDKTGGRYYQAGCNLDMPAYLKDYASRVIFRAYVHGKNRIRLSAPPIQTNTITLTIGGVLIPGNTGAASDKWTYDAGTNEVVINWFAIDQGQIKPGDQIRIKFRVS